MAKQEWWKQTSAADDADREGSLFDDQWLDDFDFDDYRSTSASASVGSFWGRYGSADRTNEAERIAAAQAVVQGFVNTFATGDLPYRVTFSESVATAGTSFEARAVVVSHKPLFDPTLTDDEANTVLTAMAVHEASHVRYGRETDRAVNAEWHTGPQVAAARRLANILDDVRIEARFSVDYPGYADVFGPALAYVARSTGGAHPTASALSPLDLVVGAVRYAPHVDWTGHETDRDWWIDWSVRGTADDTPETHVAAVREGLRRLAAQAIAKPKPAPVPEQDETDDEVDETDDRTDETTDATDAGERTTERTDADETEPNDVPTDRTPAQAADAAGGETDGPVADETPDDATLDQTPIDASGDLGDCFADAIDRTAEENGETSDMSEAAAQQLVEAAKALVDDGLGGKGEVYESTAGLIYGRGMNEAVPSPAASAAIRSAFMRSRTGHYDKQAGYASGRIDNRGIVRIAQNDYRVFNRRTAPSEGRYLVWLLVDCSGSMRGRPIRDAVEVSAALGAASRGLPNLRLSIYGWSTGLRLSGATFGAARVWTTGDPIGQIGDLVNLGGGGTPDAEVLGWASKAILAQATNGEQPVIILASDGQGSLQSRTELIAQARRSGVQVVSVSLGSGVTSDAQARMFGAGSSIPFLGTIARTAAPLGKLVARIASGKVR